MLRNKSNFSIVIVISLLTIFATTYQVYAIDVNGLQSCDTYFRYIKGISKGNYFFGKKNSCDMSMYILVATNCKHQKVSAKVKIGKDNKIVDEKTLSFDVITEIPTKTYGEFHRPTSDSDTITQLKAHYKYFWISEVAMECDLDITLMSFNIK